MRRRGFPLFRGRREAGDLPPALQHAHELMARGDYNGAAVAFEQLAKAAESRQGPRAPFFFVQAGNARIHLNQVPAGMAHIRHGMEMLRVSGRHKQFYHVGQRAMLELSQRGLEKEAQEIAALIGANMPAIAELPTERGPEVRNVSLPTHCPSCGGPLRPGEVEWLDEASVECSYCGSPVKSE